MAIKELFYDNRPQVLLDPRASQRIDPRFKFTRNSTATYVDTDQTIKIAETNQPRFKKPTPIAADEPGLLSEPAATNRIAYSESYAESIWTKALGITVSSEVEVAPDPLKLADKLVSPNSTNFHHLQEVVSATNGQSYTLSFYAKAAGFNYIRNFDGTNNIYFALQGAGSFTGYSNSTAPSITLTANGWYYCVLPFLATSTSVFVRFYPTDNNAGAPAVGDGSKGVYLWGVQLEEGSTPTSYIQTGASSVTRAADLLSVEAPLPASGSVYIDARAIAANENDTLLSLKNSSNDKIDLAYLSNASTYNSLALIANYDGTSKSSLPLPVPTTDRERNIITWGSQNYQYGRDSSRFATSLSSSVPTGLNQLSIGHDAVDPTKAFNGYINTVYAWSGELTPAVAEALVRNEIDAINADTYSPTGPAGSLALVINTQGATASGEKTFTLPAESAANDNDIVITWGDGTESGLDGTDAEVGSAALTHTYPAAGIYPVWVEGQMQNIYYNNIANAPDLVQIAAWGTGDMFTAPTTMANAFYGCTQMDFSTSARTTNRPDTSAVQNWSQAFYNCSSITGTFPAFNFSAATNFTRAWRGCSSMTSFVAAGDQTQNVTNFDQAWRDCSSLTSFPLINTSAGTMFYEAWKGCSSLTSFPLINTSNATSLYAAWDGCIGLTGFPSINTSSVTNFYVTWRGCSSLTSFPLLDTSSSTGFVSTWENCNSLTSFPLVNTSAGTNFTNAWRGCYGLLSMPQVDTSAGTIFFATWLGCSALTSFPLIDTSSATNLSYAWTSCAGLTSFPLIDTASADSLYQSWSGCTALAAFPLITTSACTNFAYAWFNCQSLASFPAIDTSLGTNFAYAWYDNDALTSFPALNFDAASGLASDSSSVDSGFRAAWNGCGALTDFPANLFNNTTCTRYINAWTSCALTAASIENIIVSINAAGTSNGNLGLNGGTNAGASTWTAPAIAAYDALVARGWTITRNA
jgi:hypothetical protein